MAKSSFELYDYWQVSKTFERFYGAEQRGIDDYLMRKRKEELCALLRKVIRNELSEQAQLLIKLQWYQGKSKEEIGRLTGLSRSSVYRRFDRITDTLYEKLKYALEYRFDKPFSEAARAMIRCEMPGRFGERSPVALLCEQHGLSLKAFSELTGIGLSRVRELKENADAITLEELQTLQDRFGWSVLPLLKGKGLIH